MKNNVLILSEDAVFARMLELELQMRKLSVTVSRELTECVDFCVALVDLDTSVIPDAKDGTRIIGFTRSDAVAAFDPDRRCSMILHRPFEVFRLVEEVEGLVADRVSEGAEVRTLTLLDKCLSFGEGSVSLSPKETLVMECLLAKRGEAVERGRIAALLGATEANKPEVYICHLRQKLEKLTNRATIRTVRGIGYRLEEK